MRLSLMRHANAEHSENNHDFERILSDNGQLEAIAAGKFLHKHKIDRVIVSYVKRTMQTFGLIQEQIGQISADIVTELYKNEADVIYDLLSAEKNNYKHILVIGHNPLIYEIALMLTNPISEHHELLITTMMPTARIIVLDFPEIDDWQNIGPNQGNIIEIFTPKIT